jgi:hypothetical protein
MGESDTPVLRLLSRLRAACFTQFFDEAMRKLVIIPVNVYI